MALLEKLIKAYGVSGNEGEVRNIIRNEIRRYADEVSIDKMGNLIARKRGRGPRVMLVSHMDEVGLMLRSITPEGIMTCASVGYIEPMILVGQRVHICTKKGLIHAIVSTRQISSDHEFTKLPQMNDLIVDAGISKKELVKLGVAAGSYISLQEELVSLGSKKIISGKALDDRLGCYALIGIAKKLRKSPCDIYYVFTVQEELEMAGAKTASYRINPDWAIVVDATNANDLSENPTKRVGGGPCVTVKDREMVANMAVCAWLEETAKKAKIPVQIEVSNFGTTDALSISISRGGIPSGVVSIPVRNLHTTASIASMDDVNATIKLVEALLKKAHRLHAG